MLFVVSCKAFLRSEVSAENILFYQACEKFRKIPPSRMKEVLWDFSVFSFMNPSYVFDCICGVTFSMLTIM
jgi:hypothetical protein